MTRLRERAYRDDRELTRMLAMVTASALADGPAVGHLHRGDVVWGLFQNTTIDPATRIRLFEDDRGALRGFAWLFPPRACTMHLNAALPLAPGDIATILRAAEGHLEPGGSFSTDGPSLDTRLQAGFAAAGYRGTGAATYQLNAQPLSDTIPAPVLPPGATVRPLRGDDPADVAARVELHREVWAPSKFTLEGYERLRAMPVYRADLDLVAVTPEGVPAAYCIVWWDPESRTGELEPVGTSAQFRRQGYGRALLLHALRRLRELGAEHAVVISGTDADAGPARRLYEAVGFRRVLRFDEWERDPSGG